MKAVTIPRFGGADVLSYTDVPAPEPGKGEVSIDVEYAGVNYAEILFRQGAVDVPLPYVPGIEAAGRIRALGEGVDSVRVGQRVAALTMAHGGGYGEVAVTDAHLVAPLPDSADLRLAATIPSNSTTALLVLGTVARLRDGETVLVHAAAGGVGSQLGQVAHLLGAGRVVGTVGSEAKIPAAKAFGYDELWLRDELPGKIDSGEVFDVVVDPVGGSTRQLSLDALKMGGRLVAMGNASGGEDLQVSANTLWFSGKGILGFNLGGLSASDPSTVEPSLRRAVAEVFSGKLHVDVTRELPLAEAAAAHEALESGATTGKMVLSHG